MAKKSVCSVFDRADELGIGYDLCKKLRRIRRSGIFEKEHAEPTERDVIAIETISLLYTQQEEMHEQRKTKVDHRIVSIEQPWVRPIVRGKAHANTEFGEKLHLCIEDGFSRVDYVSFEAYNKASRLTDGSKTGTTLKGSTSSARRSQTRARVCK